MFTHALLSSPIALAQEPDALSDAHRLFLEGDFERARRAYRNIHQGESGLNREQLETSFAELAQVEHALRSEANRDRALRLLLSLNPSATLPDSTPPSLRERLEALRSQVTTFAIEPQTLPLPEGTRLSFELVGERELLRSVTLFTRSEAGGRSLGDEGTLLAAGEEYWVEFRGPGGTLLRALGSEARPERATAITTADPEMNACEAVMCANECPNGYAQDSRGCDTCTCREDDEEGGSALPWILVATGVVVAGVAVGLAVAFSGGETRTQPSAPMPLP